MIQAIGQTTLDPVTATTADAADVVADAGAAAAGGDTINQQQFLMLFISQLQNQDPLNPLDANGLTEQLAQFSSLEQLFSINSTLDAVREAFVTSTRMAARAGFDWPVAFKGLALAS